MANHRNRFPARRRFLKQSTALTASVVALPLPHLARAQSVPEPSDETVREPPLKGHEQAQAQQRRQRDRKQ